jgi:hypothetical protein
LVIYLERIPVTPAQKQWILAAGDLPLALDQDLQPLAQLGLILAQANGLLGSSLKVEITD